MAKIYKELSIQKGDKIKLKKKFFSDKFLSAYINKNEDTNDPNYDYNKKQYDEGEKQSELNETFNEKKEEYEKYKEKTLSNLTNVDALITRKRKGELSDTFDYVKELEQYNNNIKMFTDQYKELEKELEDMRQNSLDKSLKDIILYFSNQYRIYEFYGYIYEGENKYSNHLVNLRPFDSYEDDEDKPRDFYYVLPKTALTTYNFELIKEETPPVSEPEPPTGGKRTRHRRKSRTNHRRKSRTNHRRKSRKSSIV